MFVLKARKPSLTFNLFLFYGIDIIVNALFQLNSYRQFLPENIPKENGAELVQQSSSDGKVYVNVPVSENDINPNSEIDYN